MFRYDEWYDNFKYCINCINSMESASYRYNARIQWLITNVIQMVLKAISDAWASNGLRFYVEHYFCLNVNCIETLSTHFTHFSTFPKCSLRIDLLMIVLVAFHWSTSLFATMPHFYLITWNYWRCNSMHTHTHALEFNPHPEYLSFQPISRVYR